MGPTKEKTLKHPVFFDQSGNGVLNYVTKCLEFHPEILTSVRTHPEEFFVPKI